MFARWQDCVVGGDLRPRRGGKAAKPVSRKGKRARRGPSRTVALDTALRSALESFIVSIADRAAENVHGSWRSHPAGSTLLADAAAEQARGEYTKRIFESAFGDGAAQNGTGEASQPAFSRSSPDLAPRAARAIGAWQDHLTRLVEMEDLRPAARRIAFDDEALSLVVLVAMLGEDAPGTNATSTEASASDAEGTSIYTEPRRLLTTVLGPGMLAETLARARADLLHRVRLLLDEETVRFVEVIEGAGPCEDVAAIRLYQAEFSLEAVR